jgi:transposase-like protein
LEREALVSNRRKFDPEFREGAVRIVVESGRPIAQVARDLGVHEGTLGNWVAKAREARGGADAPPPYRRSRVGGGPAVLTGRITAQRAEHNIPVRVSCRAPGGVGVCPTARAA